MSAAFLVSCDGATGPAGPPIAIQALTGTLLPCGTAQLTATGSAVAEGVNWSSSKPLVADVSPTGLLTAYAPGTARISASPRSDGTLRADLSVTVGEDALTFELSGGVEADTITAVVDEGLRARATWSAGCAAVGVPVRFTSPIVTFGPSNDRVPAVAVGEVGTHPMFISSYETAADDDGVAAAAATLGLRSGIYDVTVGSTAASGSAFFRIEVLPGGVAQTRGFPADTAIYVGATYALRDVGVFDRGWNRLMSEVEVGSSNTAIASVAGSRLVTANGEGRAAIMVGDTEVAHVSVVPQGVLALARIVEYSSVKPAVVLLALDGSVSRTIYESEREGFSVHTMPGWHPGGAELVVTDVIPGTIDIHLSITDTLGNARPLLSGAADRDAWGGAYSTDGSTVYFTTGSDLVKAQPGDQAPTFVAGVSVNRHPTLGNTTPSLSPDGARLVSNGEGDMITVVDLSTNQPQPLGVVGMFPAWSPLDGAIAYIQDGRVWLMATDGTGQRPLTDGEHQYGHGLTWSPDGRWLVTRSLTANQVHLIDAASGTALPLAFANWLGFASWRP